MLDAPLRFIHISDTHFGPTAEFTFHGRKPFTDVHALFGFLRGLPVTPDFVIHTGDVVSFQDPKAYDVARELFAELPYPLFFATGNHDDTSLVASLHKREHCNLLCGTQSPNAYWFRFKECLCVVLDGKHANDQTPSGVFYPEQEEALATLLKATKEPFLVFCHYPIFEVDSPWMDENLLLARGEALHELLERHKSRCRGYFYGHLHQSIHTMVDGISYVCAPSATFQFAGFPNDRESVRYAPEAPAAAHIVTVVESAKPRVIVKGVSHRSL